MTNNPDLVQFVIPRVDFKHPKLDQTYRFDQTEKRSEPCAPTAQNAEWSLNWLMKQDEARALIERFKKHYEECRTRNAKLPPFSKVFGVKKVDDGMVMFKAKKRGVNKKGEVNKPPVVVDHAMKDLADRNIWSGSHGTVRVIAIPATDPQDGSGGITLFLDGVQVIKPVYGGSNMDGFEAVDMPAEDFSSVAASVKAAGPKPDDLF
jgi:hypothetical protein